VRIEVGSATDIGRVRERNEDSILVDPPLFVVADGMGGHRGGQVASQVALETMEELASDGKGSLADHVRRANRAVWDRSVQDEQLAGMGTTLTAARVEGPTAFLAHVGDSRAYLLREAMLRKLTTDHTLVERMVRSGEITEAEADVHPHKNVLTRALGTDESVEVDEEALELIDGDRLLLCSDGLTGMVTEDQIQAILETTDPPQHVADRLVKAANRAGGIDNISVVVIDAIGEGDEVAPGRRRVAPPSRGTLARWGLRAGVALLVLLVVFFAGRWYLDRQWYVGADGEDVAIFQGVPLTVLGVDLGWVVERTSTPADEVATLEDTYPTFEDGIPVTDREAARELVEQMQQDVREARRAAAEDQGAGGGGAGAGGGGG
jgi:serine/threonine protein phosphatase PrpC